MSSATDRSRRTERHNSDDRSEDRIPNLATTEPPTPH